ncbi:hypothetical protein ACEPAH_829 [Sanghuangporus vaninii]
MPRRKPVSGKQRKAELQVKRAIKRGDPPETVTSSRGPSTDRGRGGIHRRGNRPVRANIDTSRRLESSFVKFSPELLEEAKRKASSLIIKRPIAAEKSLFPISTDNDNEARKLIVPRRPKWRYDMSKKEVEANEVANFKRWLDETDHIIQGWKADVSAKDDFLRPRGDSGSAVLSSGSQALVDDSDHMSYAPPLFERNLEVWRQLWRVIEICEVLLVLVDSRCPPLHYPASLNAYLLSYRPLRKVVFVLTKVDITGPKRSYLWKEYLRKTYPSIRVVTVESYLKKDGGEGQGKRVIKEPYIPGELRSELVRTLREVHNELCTPPPHISSDANKLANWSPAVVPNIDWNAVLNATDSDITHDRPPLPTDADVEDSPDVESTRIKEFLSVGLIGQPNVGKSSLLNALFGRHKVKASKTPGKTKHFQTLFWSKQVRLVDCPGLVFPSFTDLEMQVLAGILPISQIPAIPSSIYHALQYLPLESILMLQHPAEKDGMLEDRRTWRAGMQPNTKSTATRQWTAMDVLTALAEKNGWITAKAGRPDINRAGRIPVLRALAEGRIKWAFYPPDTVPSTLAEEDKGQGIWIRGEGEDIAEHAFSDRGEESDQSLTDSEDDDIPTSESTGDDAVKDATPIDFGMQYSQGADGIQWPQQYRSFTSHSAFNAELSRIADATELKSPERKFICHTATFQPFMAPKPGAKPSEDWHVFQIWDLPSGKWSMAAVFDGHAGEEIAEYAHVALPTQIRLALESIDVAKVSPQSIPEILAKAIEEFDKSIGDELKALLPKNFENLDEEALKKLVNDQESGSKVYNACIRCMRGSTAIIALIDPGMQNLWVANLGDCQAVLVEYPAEKTDFTAAVLSSPHNARVDKEVQRVQFEHPGEREAILNDRVLGAIAVTRALGDFTFKLPAVYTTKLFVNVNLGYRMHSKVEEFIPRNLTPPYVSATPDVTHRTLKSSMSVGGRTTYALVLCSDGLTDPYYARGWTTDRIAQHFASVCSKSSGKEWDGLGGNLALHLCKDALGESLEEQSRNLTVDLDFQHLDDTTAIVLSW